MVNSTLAAMARENLSAALGACAKAPQASAPWIGPHKEMAIKKTAIKKTAIKKTDSLTICQSCPLQKVQPHNRRGEVHPLRIAQVGSTIINMGFPTSGRARFDQR